MLVKIPSYYKEFKCIAGECTDSCCTGWKIIIDEQSAEKYRQHTGILKERFAKKMICRNGQTYFLLEKGRCPFLNHENLCDIYIHMGKEALSHTCFAYPRRIRKEGNVMEAGLSLSCPEAARLMLEQKEGIRFERYDNGMQAAGERTEWEKFLDELEEVFFLIIKDRQVEWKTRLRMILFLADNITATFDTEYKALRELIQECGREDGRKELAEVLSGIGNMENEEMRQQVLSEMLGVYEKICLSRTYKGMTVELLQEYRKKGIRNSGKSSMHEPYLYQYENYITYYIFRHLKECTDSRDIFDMTVMMCVSYGIIWTLDKVCEDKYGRLSMDNQIEIMHYYSKIMEHSDKDYRTLLGRIKECGYNTMACMMVLL